MSFGCGRKMKKVSKLKIAKDRKVRDLVTLVCPRGTLLTEYLLTPQSATTRQNDIFLFNKNDHVGPFAVLTYLKNCRIYPANA
jgi:hypothetical protein